MSEPDVSQPGVHEPGVNKPGVNESGASEPASPSLFASLDAKGLFHRDTAVGRMFHRGAVSFREVSEKDSLHVSVLPGNRVSVHVDRVSPLAVNDGGRCRYSLLKAVAHNAAVVVDIVRGLARRSRGLQRCDLDCEVVWVPDETATDGEAEAGTDCPPELHVVQVVDCTEGLSKRLP